MADDNLIFDGDVDNGAVNTDVADTTDAPTDEPTDTPTDEPVDTPTDEPIDDDLPELDDETLLKVLGKRGIETDSLSKITASLKDMPALTRKHQLTKAQNKAVRAKLEAQGIDPDDFMRDAQDSYDGKTPKTSKTPASMQGYKPEQVKALGEIVGHFGKKQLEDFIPVIVQAVREDSAFGSFADSVGKDRDELSGILNETAKKHGINGRDKETLKLLYKISQGEFNDAVGSLPDNENGAHTKTKLGTPPPKGQSRTTTKAKMEGKSDEDWRKEHEKTFGKK